MKYTIISLLLLACQSLSAQYILTKEANVPQLGDRLRPLQVELPKDAYDEELHLWDFNRMQSLEKNSRQRYMMTGDSVRHHTARIEDGQRAYYDVKGDSLLLTGHENRLTKMMYDEPELFLHFPMQLGDSVEGYFHGRGTYCNRIALHSYGRYHTKITEAGSMVLPEGDTLRHVLLIHTERITGEQYYPDIHHDSLSIFTTDSIIKHLAPDTAKVHENIYRWYAEGYRYPVLEAKTVTYCGKRLTEEMYYYPPEVQEQLVLDEENKAVRARLASEEGNGDGSSLADDGWGRNGGHGGFNYHVSQNEGNETVTVSYSSEKPVKVTTMLANSQGYVYRRAEQTDGSAITLSYSTLRHGQYILYVSAGNEQFAEKFSVK